MWMSLGLTAAYLAIHFLMYLIVLREFTAMQYERGIFRYHFFSAVVMGFIVIAVIALSPSEESFAIGAGMLALHGLYSISFLEIWSLAQGGYSLSILQWAAKGKQNPETQSMDDLGAIGDGKRVNRLAGLISLGLVCEDSGLISLTNMGKIFAKFLKLMVRLTNMRSIG